MMMKQWNNYQNIKTILEELGSSLEKILKTTVFMVSGNDFSILNKVYGEVFPINAPAPVRPSIQPFPLRDRMYFSSDLRT